MDPRRTFLDSINCQGCRVNHYRGFILLCGGAYNLSEATSVSVRDYLLTHPTGPFSSLPIELAEDITDWWRDATYDDLITFERDIAELAGLIVIVIESPGSIAEFAAFSQIPGIREKLLVFIDEKYYRENSFIALGPLLSLKSVHPDAVMAYPWMKTVGSNHRYDEESMSRCFSEMVNDIENAYGAKNHKAKFSPSIVRHHMLLIYDLIDLMRALTITEIEEYIKSFGITLDRKRIAQYLYILDKMQLIEVKSWGKTFYAPKLREPLFQYAFKDGSPTFDRARFKVEVANFYQESEPKRSRLIKAMVREGGPR